MKVMKVLSVLFLYRRLRYIRKASGRPCQCVDGQEGRRDLAACSLHSCTPMLTFCLARKRDQIDRKVLEGGDVLYRAPEIWQQRRSYVCCRQLRLIQSVASREFSCDIHQVCQEPLLHLATLGASPVHSHSADVSNLVSLRPGLTLGVFVTTGWAGNPSFAWGSDNVSRSSTPHVCGCTPLRTLGTLHVKAGDLGKPHCVII